ncbi:MAG: HEPN domain-containing protein [Deltaproteobacteria bacterium]|nr:HEPN domain-containing protein [Deltaproteobacteria bacterium]
MVTLKDARNAAKTIIKILNPVSITVFGSVAKNGTGNDLDIFVITNGVSDQKEEYRSLYGALKKYRKKFGIDQFVIQADSFKKLYNAGSPFLNLIAREGRVLYMKEAVKEWFNQSKNELDMARVLLKAGYPQGACYHAQQSAEKAIKFILLKNGWELEKTHDIDRLLEIGKKLKIKLAVPDEDVEFINSIYEGRYPSEAGLLPYGQPSDKDAERAVKIAADVYNNINKNL